MKIGVKKSRNVDDLLCRIGEYLSSGGLFNPELADHEAVRDLLMACRDELTNQDEELKRVHKLPDLEWIKCKANIMQRLATIRRSDAGNEIMHDEITEIVRDLDKGTLYVKRIERAANITRKRNNN